MVAFYVGIGKNLDARAFFSGSIDGIHINNIDLTTEQVTELVQYLEAPTRSGTRQSYSRLSGPLRGTVGAGGTGEGCTSYTGLPDR